MDTQQIFTKLWKFYTEQNPQAKAVYDSFIQQDEEVVNDHIAFRTFDDPRISVDKISAPFLEGGYMLKGEYTFPDKHLYARHFEHPSLVNAPRVFISQLITKDFSQSLQDLVKSVVDQIPVDIIQSGELIYSGRQWKNISYSTYESLRNESEYAAWLYVWGFCANHFTVSVNHLKKLNTLEKVNRFIKVQGFTLNDSGGEIKGTPAELLEQSSTRAGKQLISFIDGSYDIPACYYEFARRYPDQSGQLYSGFIAKSADKIFESTDNK